MFKISKKILIGGAIGNALEMYDYVIWGLFSAYLSKEFLPPQSKLSNIFLLFLMTYVLRPVGALFGGILADQIGRKKVLILSLFSMGICTSLVGILPSYNQIGVYATFFLLLIRFIQVFSIGGEYITSISLLIESSEKNRAGYFGSWAAFGLNFGTLFASLLGAFTLHLIDMHLLPEWGWRLAFIFSILTMVAGMVIRYSLPESFPFIMKNARNSIPPFSSIIKETFLTLKSQLVQSFLVFFLVWLGTATTVLLFLYAPIHMNNINHISSTESLIINSCSLAVVIVAIPFFGYLSDFFGRIKIIFYGISTLLVLILPYFNWLSTGSFSQVLIAHILVGIPAAALFAVIPVFITELFPLAIRCSITNFIYSIAVCLGGGITPVLALNLAGQGVGRYFPSLIIIILGFINFIFMAIFYLKYKKNRPFLNQLYLVKEVKD